jgi:glycerol-3-phosphate O-acyltransferase
VSQPPIFGFNAQRGALVEEVSRRVVSGVRDARMLLSEAAFLEVKRQQISGSDDVVPLSEWRSIAHSLGRMTDDECRSRLEDVVHRHARDVAGNFDPRVYKFASRAAAPILGMLMSPMQTLRHAGGAFDLRALDGRVIIEGPVGSLQRLAEQGTLVFVPTHLSNLDSVVFGFALERAGLPPATYGAGKNLFTNPVLSFFMHNLGAYRVDRRLKHGLYKEVLKSYSCLLIEHGYHSLFFPGGTRSRSGGVERKLKLGLAGTGVEAMARTAAAGHPRRVFFVPATINYLLTLEAETLVDDFLSEEGRHRYIIEDDESARPRRIASFIHKLLGLDAGCVIRFGTPLDCFGNTVDEDAVSRDARGHVVDPLTYLTDAEDKIGHDPARDAQYTRELGEAIVAAYQRDTVAMATHLVAACAFEKMCERMGARVEGGGPPANVDIFAMLRDKDDVLVPRAELADRVERLRDRARELESKGRIVLGPRLARASGRDILDEALRAFSGYHTSQVLEPRGDSLLLVDTRLIFYYQNRLAGHGLAVDLIARPGSAREGKSAHSALRSRAPVPASS